jgi:hypothetical protein
MFSMIRRIEAAESETMAIKTAPSQPETPKPSTSRALVRVGGWAGGALLAVALLALTAQTDTGSERLRDMVAVMTPSPANKAEVPPEKAEPVPENSAEIKRLETLVVALANDRERLQTRVASLERKLDDTTGSIKQQQANLAAKVAASAVPPAASPPAPQQVVPIFAPLSMASTVESVSSWPANATPQASPTEPVPLPPVRVTSAPVEEPANEAPRKPEIGVDLGGAANLEILSARWTAVKANFGPQLSGLYPRAIVSNRAGAEYRLLAGPLPNNAAAAQLCARFVTARVTCRTVRFEGERLVQR